MKSDCKGKWQRENKWRCGRLKALPASAKYKRRKRLRQLCAAWSAPTAPAAPPTAQARPKTPRKTRKDRKYVMIIAYNRYRLDRAGPYFPVSYPLFQPTRSVALPPIYNQKLFSPIKTQKFPENCNKSPSENNTQKNHAFILIISPF